MSHLEGVGGKSALSEMVVGMKADLGSEVEERHKATLTLDGEDQWTCTPGSSAEVPEQDELYDRRTDPFQLNNVITKYPDIAADLFRKLSTFIADMKSC